VRKPAPGRLTDYTFFIDRSLGRFAVAEALRGAGVWVETHDQHFQQDEQDGVWLLEVGRRGWVY